MKDIDVIWKIPQIIFFYDFFFAINLANYYLKICCSDK